MADGKTGLTSMKRDASHRRNFASTSSISESEYGYGLSIRLENDDLEKLKLAKPKVGKEFMIAAVGKVTAVHESDTEGGSQEIGVTIQITDLGLR